MAETTGDRSAVIIASSEYQDPDLRQLVAPAQDVDALGRVLAAPDIGGFEVETHLNEPSHVLRQAVEAFLIDRSRDDLVLLYFSGHGLKDEYGRLYFATPETQRKRLRSTALSANYVNEVMRDSRSRRQVLLLDCCYSGAFAEGMVAKADESVGTMQRFKGRGRVVLTASDALQYAFEGDEVKGEGVQSVFTRNLVDGLETGEADQDQDGRISLDELYDFVYDRVVEKTPGQKPGKWAFDVQGDILIARNPNPVIKAKELPPELQESLKDLRPWVREGAVRALDRLLSAGDPGLAQAAIEALERLKGDDSRAVSEAATKSLARYAARRGAEEHAGAGRKRRERHGEARVQEEGAAETPPPATDEAMDRAARSAAEAKLPEPGIADQIRDGQQERGFEAARAVWPTLRERLAVSVERVWQFTEATTTWGLVVLTAVGWAMAGFVGEASSIFLFDELLHLHDFSWIGGRTVVGLLGGASIGFVARRSGFSLEWKHVAAISGGWAVSLGAASFLVPLPAPWPSAIGGALGGASAALVFRTVQLVSRASQLAIVALAWAVADSVYELALLSGETIIFDGQPATVILRLAALWGMASLIGGAAMWWQVPREP